MTLKILPFLRIQTVSSTDVDHGPNISSFYFHEKNNSYFKGGHYFKIFKKYPYKRKMPTRRNLVALVLIVTLGSSDTLLWVDF